MPPVSGRDPIASIDAHVKTGPDDDVAGGSYDDDAYLGIAGREFKLDLPGQNDLDVGQEFHYIYGAGGNTAYDKYNDPRSPQLTFDDVLSNDVYVRINPSDDWWHVEHVQVSVRGVLGSHVTFEALNGSASQWLGNPLGLILHLKRSGHQADESEKS
ncbi:hypothetical protein GCM10022419_031830 [Nonomuraea rosea]|uniref:PLAT domain-containing protein n=1 Tax=Nonomuraea rosea TaxID=638574 RepID=A0ABP6WBQ9_9ACTN